MTQLRLPLSMQTKQKQTDGQICEISQKARARITPQSVKTNLFPPQQQQCLMQAQMLGGNCTLPVILSRPTSRFLICRRERTRSSPTMNITPPTKTSASVGAKHNSYRNAHHNVVSVRTQGKKQTEKMETEGNIVRPRQATSLQE